MNTFCSSHSTQTFSCSRGRRASRVFFSVLCISRKAMVSGCIQVLREPRRPSQQWPSAKRRVVSVVESLGQRQQRTPPSILSVRAQQFRQLARVPEVRVHRSPDEVAAMAKQRVLKLEAALQTLGEEGTPKAKAIQCSEEDETCSPRHPSGYREALRRFGCRAVQRIGTFERKEIKSRAPPNLT